MLKAMTAVTSAVRFAGLVGVQGAGPCSMRSSLAVKRSACTPLTTQFVAHFSQSHLPPWGIITKAEVITGMNAGELDLIDVREEDEVKATGPFQTTAEGSSVDFPGAVVATAQNLPLSAIKIGALHMNDDDFEEAFGFVKPRMDRHTVFACRSGMRSGTACGIAKGAGYQQLSNYKGSALEWFGEK